MTGEVQYEPSAVGKSGTENPYQKSHIELMNTFNPLVTDPAVESKADYAKIADGWERDMQIFAARIKRSSESAWTGTAATVARQAISDYANDALNLTPALKALSSGVGQAVDAVLTTKKNMPEYEDPFSWWVPLDYVDMDREEKAEANAQRVVLESFVNPMVATDGQVPVLPTPKDPVTSTTPQDTNGGNPNGGGNPTTTQTPQTQQPETTPESTTPETEDPDEDTDSPGSDTDDDTTEESETPETTDPQSTTPASTTPASTTPQTPTAGTPLGAGSPSGGSPGGGVPGVTAGVPGAAVPGTPGAAAAKAGVGAGGAGAGATGRSGMPGMGGMAPGGARGGNNDDDEHTTPDYLVYDRESELLGTQPPALPPGGVIGG